jgi:Trk-type K+ transport system membrane component
MSKVNFKSSPFRIIAALYLASIFFFAILYLLPMSTVTPMHLMDAWFLSSSAMSVTGLSSINITEQLTVIGQAVLMIQIQIGGLGIMVILGVLLMFFNQNMTLTQQTLISLDQNQKGLKSMKKLVSFIVIFSLLFELVGLMIFFPIIHQESGEVGASIFISLFHAIASFTGAGFDLFGGSLIDYSSHALFVLTSSVLIFLGAIGFPTLLDLFFSKGRKKTLFTKVNILTHGFLLVIGFFLFLFFEFQGSFVSFNFIDKVTNAFFLSMTSRNAGLSTIELDMISSNTLFLLLMLMFIGGSASSCAGGIRTTTFAVLVAKVISVIKGKGEVVIFKKSLHDEDVNKSFLVFFSFLGLFLFSTIVISTVESFSLEYIMFEVMSALTTTGLSVGITEDLTNFSKIWVSMLMIVGRIGIIAIVYTLIKPKKTSSKYIKEHIIVG